MKIPDDTLFDFLNTMPAVLYEYVLYKDRNSEFVYVSPTSLEILGHPPEYFIEDMNNFWKMLDHNDLKRLQDEDMNANIGNEYFVSEVRCFLPSGTQKWIRLSSKPTSKKKNDSVIWSGYIIDISQQKDAEAELKKLRGILPICMYCKKIRDNQGCWNQLEKYFLEHSEVQFSHGICETCKKKVFPEA